VFAFLLGVVKSCLENIYQCLAPENMNIKRILKLKTIVVLIYELIFIHKPPSLPLNIYQFFYKYCPPKVQSNTNNSPVVEGNAHQSLQSGPSPNL
jgi:hypothetical protein